MRSTFFFISAIGIFTISGCKKDCNCEISNLQEKMLLELDSLVRDSAFLENHASYLSDYGELPIFDYSKEVYRYTYQGAFGKKEVIRIEDNEEEYKLHIYETDNDFEDYDQDAVIRNDKWIISQEEFALLKATLIDNCFWTMSYLDTRSGLDGYSISIEAFNPIKNQCTGRKYHAVSKWVPIDTSFVTICEAFEKLVE